MDEVLVRIAQPLRLFLAARHRGPDTIVGYDGTASLGHVVESLGVPLTEVGPLTLDGRSTVPTARLHPGAVIDVHPVTRPQPVRQPLRFVLDVHLGTLARRLRFLGVDTAYRTNAADDDLVAQAREERRILLTRDRSLLRRHDVPAAAYVYGSDPDDQLRDVIDRFAPVLAPWTRCPRCNGPLARVDKADVAGLLQPGTRRTYDEFARCTHCGALYWHGAHSRHLDAIAASVSAR